MFSYVLHISKLKTYNEASFPKKPSKYHPSEDFNLAQ